MVKNLPAMWKTWVQSLGWEDPLEKGMATHLSILAWTIPRTEEADRYSPWSHTEEFLCLLFLKKKKKKEKKGNDENS